MPRTRTPVPPVRRPTPSNGGRPSPEPQVARHAQVLQPLGTLWLPSIALSAEARLELIDPPVQP